MRTVILRHSGLSKRTEAAAEYEFVTHRSKEKEKEIVGNATKGVAVYFGFIGNCFLNFDIF
jgi:hypothetical protein